MGTIRSSGGVQTNRRELKWPALGVVRRTESEGRPEFRPPFPCHWAVNCRLEDSLEKRLRGGSRPGLTSWDDGRAGSTISAVLPVTTGSGPALVAVSDGAMAVLADGTWTAATGVSLEGSAWCLAACGPKVFAVASEGIATMDLSTSVVASLTASAGTVPTGCTHGCVYRGRLALAGERLYFSREGDPTDWDYGADVGDTGRAIPVPLAEASEIGATVTALMPFQDTSLLAATEDSLWLVRGDPARDHAVQNLSRGVGVLGHRAWCAMRDGRVGDAAMKYGFLFLSSLGLFLVSPSGDGLESLSEDRLPSELQDIPSTTTVSLVYSPAERGVYIFCTPSSGVGTHWFFDLVHQGFWPFQLAEDHQPLDVCWHDGKVLLACQDGTVRSVGGSDDDGETVSSYVLIGPLRLAGPTTTGILTEIHGMIGAGSGAVQWKIVSGNTAEETCANGEAAITAYLAGDTATGNGYVRASGEWQAGRAAVRYPRVRAQWISVLLAASAPWAYEGMTVVSRDAGRWR